MSRAYFNFKTNLKDGTFAAVDYIAFEDSFGNIFSLSSNWDSDFGIHDGIYGARFKGLDLCIDKTNNGGENEGYEEMTTETFNFLKGSTPYELQLYIEGDDKTPEYVSCTDFEIEIIHEDETVKFSTDKLDVIIEG